MNNNTITLNNIKVNKNKIEYEYNITGGWKECFDIEESFFVEYSEDISNVPSSILVIPFLCNFLPICWVLDGTINIDVCDADFYYSIPKFKKGYIDMYPMINFLGNIKVKSIEKNNNIEEKSSAVFFSGGVDSYSTLIEHLEERPLLITLIGCDIPLSDTEGIDVLKEDAKEVAKQFNLEGVFVKSSFRMVINTSVLYRYIKDSKDDWWHGFQHGIGIIGHAAPIMYMKKLYKLYIASSYMNKDSNVTCASYPTIDNEVKFAGSLVKHDEFDKTRQDKIHQIINFSKEKHEKIKLRVCWESSGGKNCCRCEKCYRTIMEIENENDDPNDYGFKWDDEEKDEMKKRFLGGIELNRIISLFWIEIQKRFKETHISEQERKGWEWFINLDIKKLEKRK